MTTIRGIAKARWWLLVAAAVLAYVVSGELAEYRNANLPPFEAMSSVTFTEDPQALEREDFETFLDTQLALATDVNSDVIGETPGAFLPWLMAEVDLETEANQLQFIARGFTQDEAERPGREHAEELSGGLDSGCRSGWHEVGPRADLC